MCVSFIAVVFTLLHNGMVGVVCSLFQPVRSHSDTVYVSVSIGHTVLALY